MRENRRAPLKSIKASVRKEFDEMIRAISRANLLYNEITQGKLMISGRPRGPRAPDSRNVAELLFFGVASQWESFCTSVFELELKQRYRVHQRVALSIMSSVPVDADQPVERFPISGYGNPYILTDRAEFLLSVRSPWVTFRNTLGNQSFQYLVFRYRIRNYIAHAGAGKGGEDFKKVLNQLHVPAAERVFMSAGRLLLDYPSGNPITERLFQLLLTNYQDVSRHVLDQSS